MPAAVGVGALQVPLLIGFRVGEGSDFVLGPKVRIYHAFASLSSDSAGLQSK